MRCSVSELAPGVNGLMTVIGRDDRSSARASLPAVAVTARTAAKMRNARDIEGSRCSSAAVRARPTLLHLRWGRQHQRIAKLDDLLDLVGVDDFERHQSAGRILDIDVARLGDQMIQSLERHLDDVIVAIIGNAEQRQPLRLELIAKAERGDPELCLLAFEHGRDAIEERAPLLLVELAGGHGESPIWDKVRNGPGEYSACPDCERADLGVDRSAVRSRRSRSRDRPKFEVFAAA